MSVDWDSLRRRSLLPGGFGHDRVHIWPQLLNVRPFSSSSRVKKPASSSSSTTPHKDEHQIGLDTSRSFVLYPSLPPSPSPSHSRSPSSSSSHYQPPSPSHSRSKQARKTKQQLQTQLHTLLVRIFRAHPKLSYFQGYHDIISVLMLTLPSSSGGTREASHGQDGDGGGEGDGDDDLLFRCCEKLSLHFVRDSMGSGLEPVLGLLRVTKNLIRLADPELAGMLESSTQLPFFALSNLLTLFSHDTPTLPLIQHVFDYLLCRPPVAVVYLAAAFIIARKEEVRRLMEEDEDGMIHSLLSSLPELTDEPVDEPLPAPSTPGPIPASPESHMSTTVPVQVSSAMTSIGEGVPEQSGGHATELTHSSMNETLLGHEATSNDVVVSSPSSSSSRPASLTRTRTRSPSPAVTHTSISADDTETTIVVDDCSHINHTNSSSPSSTPVSVSEDTTLVDVDPVGAVRQAEGEKEELETTPRKEERNRLPEKKPLIDPSQDIEPPPPYISPSPPSSSTTQKRSNANALSLPTLLTNASTLFSTYPPSHPSLHLSQIMGPQSVIFTWSEDFREWVSDRDAESMVMRPELVVYPFTPEQEDDFYDGSGESDCESGSESDEESYEEARNLGHHTTRKEKRKRNKLVKSDKQRSEHHSKKRHARRHRKHRNRLVEFLASGKSRVGVNVKKMEKRTMLAGVVVVIGIAMAMYGVKSGSGGGSSGGSAGAGVGGGGGSGLGGGNGRHWPWGW